MRTGRKYSDFSRLLALAMVTFWAACTGLPEYETVVDRLPTGEFFTFEGAKVHIERAGSNGSPVVLVHGFGASTYSWRKVLPDLATSHRVAAVDLFGFGLTERPPEKRRYTRAGQVNLLEGLLEHLGWPSAHFVGHSYGGGIVMSLAHRNPERVRSVVLVDSTAPEYSDKRRNLLISRPTAALLVRFLLRPARIQRSLERSFYDDSAVTSDLVHAYFDRLRIEGAARAYSGLTAPAPRDPDFLDLRYQDLEQPTLALWGSNDTLITPATARRRADLIPGARFVEIPNCGHMPMEEQPQAVLDAVLPFLSEADS